MYKRVTGKPAIGLSSSQPQETDLRGNAAISRYGRYDAALHHHVTGATGQRCTITLRALRGNFALSRYGRYGATLHYHVAGVTMQRCTITLRALRCSVAQSRYGRYDAA
jgi:hypothetical protein